MTILEVLVGAVLGLMFLGVLHGGQRLLDRQSRQASDGVDQTHAALLLLETIRMDLEALVLNPVSHPDDHAGQSFLLSHPDGTSIQFVSERRLDGKPRRHLVHYAVTSAEEGLRLSRRAWAFQREEAWDERIEGSGFPAGWIGAPEESQESEWKDLGIQDLRWFFLAPEEDSGQVYFRVKLVVRSPRGRSLPFTMLVAVPSPAPAGQISACPSVNAPCFDPAEPDCFCDYGPEEEVGVP